MGAGPVGMLTALLLSEKGVPVKLIDKEQRTTTRSYACALHPGTLRLLDSVGLAEEVLRQGRRIETVAFYEGDSRRAEIRLSQLPGKFPCAVVMPQGRFPIHQDLNDRARKSHLERHPPSHCHVA